MILYIYKPTLDKHYGYIRFDISYVIRDDICLKLYTRTFNRKTEDYYKIINKQQVKRFQLLNRSAMIYDNCLLYIGKKQSIFITALHKIDLLCVNSIYFNALKVRI